MVRRQKAIILVLLLGVLGVGLAFRLAIVTSFHSSSPDGDQYYKLAQELWRNGRLAFAPPPAPLTHSRLPGYPLFLAFLVDRGPLPQSEHVVRATRANVLLDLGTAVLVWLLLRDRGRPKAAWVALVVCLGCPLLFRLSCYALSESLATFLLTLELWLALRAGQRGSLGVAVLAGMAAGLAQLVRLDAVTLSPAVALALWAPPVPRQRWRLMGAFALATTLVVIPWPVRNWIHFGAPHLEGTEWPAQDGQPLPTGAMQWMRTWCTAAPGESYLSVHFVFRRPFSSRTRGVLLPAMYDSEEERLRLAALLDRAGRLGLVPEVDREFVELARERWRRAPLRTLVVLPARRLVQLWSPPLPGELPWRIPSLGLSDRHWGFGVWDKILYVLAMLGVLVLLRCGDRHLTAVLTCAVAARSLLHSFAVPNFVNQRYLVEAFPLLIVLAAVGLVALVLIGTRAWLARRPEAA
jgi:4-amino-4-deoxy-L-arabinose transferase-like glycosyltransferase